MWTYISKGGHIKGGHIVQKCGQIFQFMDIFSKI